ncbi:MAG: DUF5060 domain-containing protein [Armatimonadetes bacterium]|nr:DUF5060 domain-containing protein [Armatimonadota bacterium]
MNFFWRCFPITLALGCLMLWQTLAAPERKKKAMYGDNRPLKIVRVTLNDARAERFGKVELTLDLQADYANPFDPQAIKVDAVFQAPSGKTLRVPGFLWQNFTRRLDGQAEKVSPDGLPAWKVRFTPEEAGEYAYTVRAVNKGREVVSPRGRFTAAESKKHGFIRTQPGSRYLRFADGTPYFALGQNVCWFSHRGTFDYDDYFKKMAESGCNYTRIWMSPWSVGIEWGVDTPHHGPQGEFPGLGRYNPGNAWRLDYILERAEKYGIHVMLCFLVHGEFRTTSDDPRQNMWRGNPYWEGLGGPCEKPEDFFNNREARGLFKRRMRYMVARWGYSTGVLSWEFFNEVDIIDRYVSTEAVAWHKEMARYLRSIDPFRHPITTSYASPGGDPEMWKLPEMDYTQTHFYTGDVEGAMEQWTRRNQSYGKPHLVGEFGADWAGGRWTEDDPTGIHLHNGLWISALSGDLGNAMLWWWDNYVAPQNLYYHFKALSEFVTGAPWNEGSWQPISAEGIPEGIRAVGLQNGQQALLWLQNRNHSWQARVRGKSVAPAPEARIRLKGLPAGKWRLEWWDTYQGQIERTEEVSGQEGVLEIRVPALETDVAVKVVAPG